MTSPAPTLTGIDLRNSYSKFVETGVALWAPDFGSVLKHSGPDAFDLLHRITTNSLNDLPDCAARQTILTSEKGRIIDAPWVIKLAPDDLLLVSDAPDPRATQDGIARYTIIEDAELTDITDDCARLMVFGDRSTESILQVFPHADFSETSCLMELGEDDDLMALRTDAAGVMTWMIIAPCEMAGEVTSRLGNLGHVSASRSLFDYVRVTNRVPIAGRELIEDVNPLEASMRHLIDFDKGCYVGQEVVARLDTYDKVQRKLVAFYEVSDPCDRGTIKPEDRVVTANEGRDIGWVSSVAVDPTTGRTLGLAYVRGRNVSGDDIELVSNGDGTAQLT